jgi:hypothetical protein
MSQKQKTSQITGSNESMRPRRVKFDGYFPGTPPALETFCCYSMPANVDNLR